MRKTHRTFGTIRKRGSKFKASYPAPLGFNRPDTNVEYYHTFESRYEAERWLSNEEELIRKNTWTSPTTREHIEQQQQVLFKDYAPQWLTIHAERKQLQDSTREKYEESLRNHLIPMFGNTPVAAISTRMINTWIESYGEHNHMARKHAYDVLKMIMHYAATEPIDDEDNTLIVQSPCRQSVKKPKPHITDERLTDEQIRALADHMPERLQLAVFLLFGFGLRISELLALRRCDIDLDTRMLHVTGQVRAIQAREQGSRTVMMRVEHTKTAAGTRHIPICDAAIPMIRQHLHHFTQLDREAILFPSTKQYGYMRQTTFRAMWKKACIAVLGNELRFRVHDARHQSVSALADTALSDGTRMSIFGHTDMKTNIHYQNMRNEELARNEMQKVLNPLFTNSIEPTEIEPVAVPVTEVQSLSNALAQRDPVSASPADIDKRVHMIEQLSEANAIRVLMGLETVPRAQLLNAMPSDTASHLLTLLPDDMQVETVVTMI